MMKQPTLAEMKYAIETKGKHTERPHLWKKSKEEYKYTNPHFWPLCEGTVMKIQFIEKTWVLQKTCEGFDGDYCVKAIQIKPVPFEVMSITKDKKKQCSDILVGSDGWCDGSSYYLINVPNGLFKQV